jgi:protein-disulfide isomerase
MSATDIDQDQRSLTRTQRRERSRAQRLAAEQAEAAKALRRTRLALLGGVLTVLVIGIVAVLIASGQGAGSQGIVPQSADGRAATRRVASLLGGIPQRGDILGRAGAPVTLQYFADLQCPVCQGFSVGALPPLIHRWVRSGELRIEYRALETATREPEVFDEQQVAALAAGKQDQMWNFVETFYLEQQEEGSGYVTEAYIQEIAQQVPGLDLRRWTRDRRDPALSEGLARDAQSAAADGLNGTPAFLIGRSGAAAHRLEPSSFTDPKAFNAAIEASLHG